MYRWGFLFALLYWRELKRLGERESYSMPVYFVTILYFCSVFFVLTFLLHFIASPRVITRQLECRSRIVSLLWEYDTLIKSDIRHCAISKSDLQQMQRKGRNEKCFFYWFRLQSDIELENELCS